MPEVQPGYLRGLIPEEAPEQGETWQSIFQDIERVIMPGVSKNLCSIVLCHIIEFILKDYNLQRKQKNCKTDS